MDHEHTVPEEEAGGRQQGGSGLGSRKFVGLDEGIGKLANGQPTTTPVHPVDQVGNERTDR